MSFGKHTHGPTFGRKVDGCLRCDELAAGAEPTQWASRRTSGAGYPTTTEIRAHNCRRSACGPVCTYGDY